MQDYVGKQIDRYRIIAQQGMGGMAVVYQAYDTRLEREVALKLIRSEAIPEEQHERLMKRFEREAKAQARFTHRHIVPIYDYGEVDGSPYLVMAFIAGGTLKLRTGQTIPYQQAIQWLIPVADALSYAHQRGVIHRDIKPSNILFDDEDQPILTDFGIAKILETDEATLTSTGLGVGTPEYMAPEQWQGNASAATDQYALGVVLYELLTGEKPYHADTPAAVAILQATEPLRSPRSIVPGIPGSIEELLYTALANSPQNRYQDMMSFQKALEAQLLDHHADPVIASGSTLNTPPSYNIDPEAATYDVIEPTPIDKLKKSTRQKPNPHTKRADLKRTSLPTWAFWSMSIVLILSILTLTVSLMTGREQPPSSTVATQSTQNDAFYADVPASTESELPTATATEEIIPTSTPTLEPIPEIGSMKVNPIDGAVMVYVPEGDFIMGSEDWKAWDNEKPEHIVYLDSFWIYQHEVTNTEYRQCVEEGECNLPGNTVFYENPIFDDHPVVYVNWNDAKAYCQWAGGQLPTEAEWEKAARGTDGQMYPWGNKNPICSLTNFSGCVGSTSQVGAYQDGASPYGAMDMAGNVWEWVADWYEGDYYSLSPYANPTGPIAGNSRVVRGGSWYNVGTSLRVSYRQKSDPDISSISYGFRCVSVP